jgi:hypothetical protein
MSGGPTKGIEARGGVTTGFYIAKLWLSYVQREIAMNQSGRGTAKSVILAAAIDPIEPGR